MTSAPERPALAHVPSWRGHLLPALGVLAATLLAYAPAIRAGFIWNDRDYVTAPGLRTWSGLARIWTEFGATEQYYPLLHSWFWVQHRLWGDSATGYHLTNILLHVVASWLFAAVLLRLRVRGAWLAAAIFALHPVMVESVAWISEQKNTLSTVFLLAAALVYLRFDQTRTRATYALATAWFVAALLSKSVTAVLPPALLVVFWWQRGRLTRREILPLVPWFVAGAAMGLFSGWFEREYLAAKGADFELSAVQRLLLAGRVPWFYAGKLIWPDDLIFIYPRWTIPTNAFAAYVPLLGAVALLAGLFALRPRNRAPLAAALLFGGMLVPVMGFFNVYAFIFSFVADHWQYLPSLALIALGGAGLATWLSRPIARVVGVAMLVALGLLTFLQSRMYRDMETFYRVTLARNPASWMAHNNLGQHLIGRGRVTEGVDHLQSALRLRPHFGQAHNNLGAVLVKTADHWQRGLEHYREAIRHEPLLAEAYSNLGAELLNRSIDVAEAARLLRRAVELKPSLAPAWGNLALAQARLGRPADEVVPLYERALQLDPNLAEAHNNLAATLAKLPGRTHEAIAHYETAVRLRPDYAEAHNNLANEYARQPDRLADALRHYERALAVAPGFAAAHYNLGNTLRRVPGRTAEAVAHYERCLELEPGFALAHLNLAHELARDPSRRADAVRHYEAALATAPQLTAARKGLARLHAAAGERARAAALAREVLAVEPGDAEMRELAGR